MVKKELDDYRRSSREIEILRSLNHPNIVRMLNHYETSDLFFIVTEFIEGQSLKEILIKEPLEPKRCQKLFHQIVEGLRYCHEQGIFHRDIKPRYTKFRFKLHN